jgi:hypothetical protein
VGIKVTNSGSSDHIVAAQVVGSSGHTNVTGAQLQQIFGLQTTYAWFTTIKSGVAWGGGSVAPAKSKLIADFVPLVRAVLNGATPRLVGSVFPAGRGVTATVEVSRRGSWRQVARRVRVSRHGRYSVALPGSGLYRVVSGGVAGPGVTVG